MCTCSVFGACSLSDAPIARECAYVYVYRSTGVPIVRECVYVFVCGTRPVRPKRSSLVLVYTCI